MEGNNGGEGVVDSDGGEGVVDSERGEQGMVDSGGGEGVNAYPMQYKMTTMIASLSLGSRSRVRALIQSHMRHIL